MEPAQNPPPTSKPVPVGTAIQVSADMLMALIESQRAEAAASAREQYKKLEQFFYSFRQQTLVMHAAEQAQVADARQKLVEMQTRFAEFQQNLAMPTQTTSAPLPLSRQIEIAPDQSNGLGTNSSGMHTPHEEEESLVKKRLEELQSALRGVGIIFSSKENTLRFEAEWVSVLEELGAEDPGVMTPGAFSELLGRLHRRLQSDRETIAQLQQKVISSEEELKQTTSGYEIEIAASKLEISMLQDDAATHDQPSETPMLIESPASNEVAPATSQVTQADSLKRQSSSGAASSPTVKRHKPDGVASVEPTPGGPFIDLRSVHHRKSR